MTRSPSPDVPASSPDELVPLRHVSERFPWLPRNPKGKRPHRSVWFRYALHGRGGVRLQTVQTPYGLATCEHWLRDFFARASGHRARPPAPTERGPAVDKADSFLDWAGI